MNGLFVRAVIAFMVLPGMVGFFMPLVWFRPSGRAFDPIGLVLLVPGLVVLLWCVREFYVSGKGTLAPWEPPRTLVVTGLYRYSRNPMYVGVVLIVWGWALGFQASWLVIYALVVMVGFHLRVLLNEEPYLARTHGEAFTHYKARVPRWFGFLVLALIVLAQPCTAQSRVPDPSSRDSVLGCATREATAAGFRVVAGQPSGRVALMRPHVTPGPSYPLDGLGLTVTTDSTGSLRLAVRVSTFMVSRSGLSLEEVVPRPSLLALADSLKVHCRSPAR